MAFLREFGSENEQKPAKAVERDLEALKSSIDALEAYERKAVRAQDSQTLEGCRVLCLGFEELLRQFGVHAETAERHRADGHPEMSRLYEEKLADWSSKKEQYERQYRRLYAESEAKAAKIYRKMAEDSRRAAERRQELISDTNRTIFAQNEARMREERRKADERHRDFMRRFGR